MKEEIAAAVFFVARLVKRYGCLDNDSRERFAAALTSALFETYKNHWHPNAPTKGQAYRCLRMNRVRLQDPVLQQACERSAVRYEDLGLPQELTVWVDPGEVSCRYGEHSSPFCVSVVNSRRADGEFSRRIHDAVERASLDVQSGSSSEEEDGEPKTIPTVSNPNSVYRVQMSFSSILIRKLQISDLLKKKKKCWKKIRHLTFRTSAHFKTPMQEYEELKAF
uniref:B-cell translocation gene 4 n=1 Tax=Echeneis naucrates TaxID=173247 RepID=A0A665TUJ1_ECHNA